MKRIENLNILTERKGNIIVNGVCGSGKTTCVTIPVMREWDGVIFALDPSGELYNAMTEEQKNSTKIFNPAEEWGTCGFDCFALPKIRLKINDVVQDMDNIAYSIIPGTKLDNDYINDFARELLAAILLYGFKVKRWEFIDVIEWVLDHTPEKIMNEISECADPDCRRRVKLTSTLSENVLGNVYSNLYSSIKVFVQDEMIKNALRKDGLHLNDLEGGTNIICRVPLSKVNNWKTIICMFIRQYIHLFSEKDTEDCSHDILFILNDCWLLDDVGLPEAMTSLKGKGIYFLIDTCTMAPFNFVYGKEKVDVMECNTRYKIYTSKITDTSDEEEIKKTEFSMDLLVVDCIDKAHYIVDKDKLAWYKTTRNKGNQKRRKGLVFTTAITTTIAVISMKFLKRKSNKKADS